ncbi:MAG: pilus assembly PilX N-terminal domain-containing protein [bacterium]
MSKFTKNKEGAILVMSLLVLSGMLVVAISMGVMVLNQLKQAKNTDYSVIAYYAADSAVEGALYKLRKLEFSADYLNMHYSSGTFQNTAEWQNNIASTTSYSALLRENRSLVVNLYDSETDCGLVKCTECIWNDLRGASGPDLEVTFYPWQFTGSISVLPERGEQEYYRSVPANRVSLASAEGPWHKYNSSLLANTCYTLRIKPLYDDADITLKAYSDEGCTNQIGIASFLTIDALGKYQTSKQRIKTVVIKDAPLNNIFEFVLFSEEPIEKE